MCVSGCGYVHYQEFTEWTFLKSPAVDSIDVKIDPNGTQHIVIYGAKSPVSEAVGAMKTGFELGMRMLP